jgi:KDO2-lipid IV(A) lauroyltransferase
VRPRHAAEAVLVRALAAGAGALRGRASHAAGARLGDLAHALGVRRRVAEDNLARAFPGRDAAWRARVLRDHYRELGRVVLEYPRLAELAAGGDEVLAGIRGLEHLAEARGRGRGCVLVTAHFGNFELAGAAVARHHPLDFVYRPLSNPAVEAWIGRIRARAGVGLIPVGAGLRRTFESLRANRCVALLGDQDARRHGVFVRFLGRPASTPVGPAVLALRTGAPLLFAVTFRGGDGRHVITIEPPLALDDPRAPDAVTRLTALHASRLEAWVRQRPEMWFWLHRRWKTPPPDAAAADGR